MFTGLIQATGRLARCEVHGDERTFTIMPDFSLSDVVDGESIAVNGTCLSVERHGDDYFTVYASGETIHRTTLGSLLQGTIVNLERAMRVGDRLGGHIVAGHVDCLARVESMEQAGASIRCRFSFPSSFAAEVITKGSVALDGISLTINACGDDWLSVNIIPDTQKRTSMRYWKPGALVNMETDVLGKYVRRCLAQDKAAPDASSGSAGGAKSNITREFLLERGFL
jgi:riboflavin synthase